MLDKRLTVFAFLWLDGLTGGILAVNGKIIRISILAGNLNLKGDVFARKLGAYMTFTNRFCVA